MTQPTMITPFNNVIRTRALADAARLRFQKLSTEPQSGDFKLWVGEVNEARAANDAAHAEYVEALEAFFAAMCGDRT